MKVIALFALAAALPACSAQDALRESGITVVAARAMPTPRPEALAATPLPPQPSAPLEAADAAPAELASLAIDQEVGVLTTVQKARDPFHAADIDLSGAQTDG